MGVHIPGAFHPRGREVGQSKGRETDWHEEARSGQQQSRKKRDEHEHNVERERERERVWSEKEKRKKNSFKRSDRGFFSRREEGRRKEEQRADRKAEHMHAHTRELKRKPGLEMRKEGKRENRERERERERQRERERERTKKDDKAKPSKSASTTHAASRQRERKNNTKVWGRGGVRKKANMICDCSFQFPPCGAAAAAAASSSACGPPIATVMSRITTARPSPNCSCSRPQNARKHRKGQASSDPFPPPPPPPPPPEAAVEATPPPLRLPTRLPRWRRTINPPAPAPSHPHYYSCPPPPRFFHCLLPPRSACAVIRKKV